jgi:DNA-directed RNA polymerase specialized sigma24 family protein
VTAVGVRLHRGRKALRAKLTDDGPLLPSVTTEASHEK